MTLNLPTYRAAGERIALSSIEMTAQGEVNLSVNTVAAPHAVHFSHQQLAEAQHNTSFHSWEAAQLYCFVCSLDLGVERGHWPPFQHISLFPTLYLLLHLHPINVTFLSVFYSRLLL